MKTIPSLVNASIETNADATALSFVGGTELTYSEVGRQISQVSQLLLEHGLAPHDKIAILSANMPNWGISYFAILALGAVAVPLLPDFSPSEIQNILIHSDTRALFISKPLRKKMEGLIPEGVRVIVEIETFADAGGRTAEMLPVTPLQTQIDEQDLAVIIYTSGTTGKSKGVMLSHKNLCSNVVQAGKVQPMDRNDRLLSILPLSHTYENTLGLLLPFSSGAAIFYLKRPPTPSVLLPALKKVRPTIMLSVPLVIEKIYFNKVQPTFHKSSLLRNLYQIGIVRKLLHRVAGRQLKENFGGALKFFGIGGAKINKTVEQFLREARFPYAIGYGLTETSPLIAGAAPNRSKLESTGPAVTDVELKIHDPDPNTGEGEVWAMGPNVMLGYYKEPGLTKEVLTDDGWFKTGDLGVFDNDNCLFLKGRSKNVIIGPSGENIYPEEIESVINQFRFVVESIVLERDGKLVALVHFNEEELESERGAPGPDGCSSTDELLVELKEYLDLHLSRFARVHSVLAHPDPFQKTATQKIKRYLYS